MKIFFIVFVAWLLCKMPYRPYSLFPIMICSTAVWFKYRNRLYQSNYLFRNQEPGEKLVNDNSRYVPFLIDSLLLFIIAVALAIITPQEMNW